MTQPIITTHWSKIQYKPNVEGWLNSGNLFNWSSKKELLIDKEPIQIEWFFYQTKDSTWYIVGDVVNDSVYIGHSLWIEIIEINQSTLDLEGARDYVGSVSRSMTHQINDAGETIVINETFPDLAVEDTIHCLIYLDDNLFEFSNSRSNSISDYYIFYDPELSTSFDHLYTIEESEKSNE